jgi:hypothetical protein
MGLVSTIHHLTQHFIVNHVIPTICGVSRGYWQKGVGWGENKASELMDRRIDKREGIEQSIKVQLAMECTGGGGGCRGEGDDHKNGSNASSPNNKDDGAEEDEAAITLMTIKEKTLGQGQHQFVRITPP